MKAIPILDYHEGEVVLIDPPTRTTVASPWRLGVVTARFSRKIRVEVPAADDSVTTHELTAKEADMYLRRVSADDRKLATYMFTTWRALNNEADRRDPERKGHDDTANALWRAANSLSEGHMLLVGYHIATENTDAQTRSWWPILRYFDRRPEVVRYTHEETP